VGGADFAVAALMAALAIGGVIAAIKLRRDPDWSRLIPGAVVTLAGFLLLIAFYRWWFDVGTCDGRQDVVCVTNQNQGVLTLLAVLVGAVAVWVEVLSRHRERLMRQREERRHANQTVGAAIEECHHNLLHAALCYTGEEMTHLPWGMSIDEICALTHREHRHLVDEKVLGHIDRIRRTYDSVRALRVRFDNAANDEEREAARAALLAEPHQFGGFIIHSLGLLRDAWIAYRDVPGCRKYLEQPGLQDLPRLAEALIGRPLYGYFRTSDQDAQQEAATIRRKEAIVACWFDDKPLGVKTFTFGPRFLDAAESHAH
jgi:hypothetical protein